MSFVRRSLVTDFDALIKSGVWPDFDPATTVVLNEGQAGYFSAGGAVGDLAAKVGIVAYGHATVDVEAASKTGGYVVLNDLWHPWWTVEVDGVQAPLLRANVLFRAVEVTPGQHKIRFQFRPFSGAWAQLRGRS